MSSSDSEESIKSTVFNSTAGDGNVLEAPNEEEQQPIEVQDVLEAEEQMVSVISVKRQCLLTKHVRELMFHH